MMRAPHFVILAQIDPQHSISACRHGMVHLTWARITVRFVKDEFQRLAGLLQRAADNLPPSSVRDGNLWVTSRPDEDCEIRMGSLVLLLAPTEFHEFARLTQSRKEPQENPRLRNVGWTGIRVPSQFSGTDPANSLLSKLTALPSLHLLWRANPHELECPRQHKLGRLGQAQPGLGQIGFVGVRTNHTAVAIEGMEGRGQVLGVVG
jgi:hypothetical protein